MTHETARWNESSFLTLTYSDEHLPMIEDTPTVRWTDGQKFLKRTRQWLWRKYKQRCSYYGVTEYGTRTKRPHMHIALFGYAFLTKRHITQERPHRLWTSQELEALWTLGNATAGALTWESAQYAAGYTIEKADRHVYTRLDESTGELVPLEQPKAYMSRSRDLAIGGQWCDQWSQNMYTHDRVTITGKHHAVPRYYDRRVSLRPAGAVAVRQIKLQRKAEAQRQDQKRAAKTRTHAQTARTHARAARNKI